MEQAACLTCARVLQALQGAAAAHRRADAGEVRPHPGPADAAQGAGEPGGRERALHQ